MRRTVLAIVAAAALTLAFSLGTAGCQKIKKMLPATTVDNPSAGEPEYVVAQVLQAAMNPDEAEGWKQFKTLLHSEQKNRQSLQSWRQFNFATARRKWPLFVWNANGDPCNKTKCDPKTTKPIYKKDYDEPGPTDNIIKIFVVNQGNPDNATPCKLKKDPQQGGEWKVTMCSL